MVQVLRRSHANNSSNADTSHQAPLAPDTRQVGLRFLAYFSSPSRSPSRSSEGFVQVTVSF